MSRAAALRARGAQIPAVSPGSSDNWRTTMSHAGASLTSEMDAAVWTAIGLLAATALGNLFYLGSRIDALASRMDARSDALLNVMEIRFARIDGRLDRVDARFDRVVARFDHMEERFDAMAERFDAHLGRHAS